MSRDVTLPNGTNVRAIPLAERVYDDPTRDFGLYAEREWAPTWPSAVIEWDDFGPPNNNVEAARQVFDAFERVSKGETVEVGCRAALGRTGTILACMAILAGVEPAEAEAWVHRNYDACAVEGDAQRAFIIWFGNHAREQGWIGGGA